MAEEQYFDRGKAMFQLKHRLDKKYPQNVGAETIISFNASDQETPNDKLEDLAEADNDIALGDDDREGIVEFTIELLDMQALEASRMLSKRQQDI
jgi:hypothetical protein